MRALLLAAGRGSRLGPITEHTPKCLVRIGGTPLLDIWIGRLARAGFKEVRLNTHYLASVVNEHVRHSDYPIPVTTWFEPTLLGTAGTIEAHREWLKEEDTLVTHADNFTLFDIESFVAAHRRRAEHVIMTMLAFRTDTPSTCGILQIDSDGLLRNMWEKSHDDHGDLANAAVYLFAPEFSEVVHDAFDLSVDVIPNHFGRIQVSITDKIHIDIGAPEALARAQNYANRVDAVVKKVSHRQVRQ